jgi:hypothetical protein
MLSKDFRGRLATRVARSARPFLSYIGADLLMHDMGYLSQVGNAPPQDGKVSQSIRAVSEQVDSTRKGYA